ncbi:MAG: bacterial Ig-like domain-containing protein [Clostridia bacterium]|nr:bacterial Ig-like domain-containing protein [Clostridia bacterium]
MRKSTFFSLLGTSGLLCGSLLLCGCGGDTSVASISVTTLPTTEYVVGNYLNLDGGKFTVVQDSGKKLELDLGLASVDTRLLDEVGVKVVTVTYAEQSATFEVVVKKANFIPQNISSASTIYNGQPQAINVLKHIPLAEGMRVENVVYKEKTDTVYSSAPPVNVGWYIAKAHILGGSRYEDCDISINYFIKEAEFYQFAEGNVFSYAKECCVTYGTDIDVSKLWIQNSSINENTVFNLNSTHNVLGPITFNEPNMDVRYECKDEKGHVLYIDPETHKVYKNEQLEPLDVGNYTISTSCSTSTQNFNHYSRQNKLSIKAKQLQIETDFNIRVSYNSTSGEKSFNLNASDGDTLGGDFSDVTGNFEIEVESLNENFSGDEMTYELEYGEMPSPNAPKKTNVIAQGVNKTGIYRLYLVSSNKNIKYTGNVLFSVVFSE